MYVDTYARVSAAAIRAEDPNHLVLGSRMNEILPGVLQGQAPYVNATDLHLYTAEPSGGDLERAHLLGGEHPVLISEFGFRARDSGLPNTKGAGPLVDTQRERAGLLRSYVAELLKYPFVVGYHLFAWAEMPGAGNLFGADSNYGVVHLDGDVYAEYAQAFGEINAAALSLHAGKGFPTTDSA